MTKRGFSFITFCLYCIFSFAQDAFGEIDSQPYSHEKGISIWVILAFMVVTGVTMFFIGMYVNKKRQKESQKAVTKKEVIIKQEAPPINKVAEPQQPLETIPPSPVSTAIDGNTADYPDKIPTIDEDTLLDLDTSAPSSENWAAVPEDTSYKLLIIEDHKDIRLYLKILFGKEYTLLMAENGEDGLKLARKELPDLIITDVMMPMMNGFECCKRLKEDLKTCHIPIIVLTAMVGDEHVVKGIELGADDYMSKPFSPTVLKTKVKRLIKSRQELKLLYSKLLKPAEITHEVRPGGHEEPQEPQEPVKVHEKEEEDPFITQIVQIVENNLQSPEFSVKRLSEMLNMSQPTLYRRVKLLTNFTIIELVRGVRLKRSAELLKTRRYNVQEVAEMVGYNDIPTFRKHFIDFYGTTPSTFGKDEA